MDSFFKKENRYPCPPNVNTVKKDVESYAENWENVTEAQAVVSCVEDYLNLYNLFVTGNPPTDGLVKEIHDKTKEMIKRTIDSRRHQKDLMERKMSGYEVWLASYCEDDTDEKKYSGGDLTKDEFCEELKDAILYGQELEEGFEDDFKVLNKLQTMCKKASNKSERIVCVESFVNMAHERGPYIPVGCGGFLPEILSEELEVDEEISLIEAVTQELEKAASEVLNCLKNYKP